MEFSTLNGYKVKDRNAIHTFDTVSDMQNATNLTKDKYVYVLGFNEVGDGGSSIYKITETGTPDGVNVFQCGNLYATAINDGIKKINIDQLESVTDGVYTLGRVTVDDAINFPRQNNRNIIIVDTVFDINTSVMITPYNLTNYFILPSFVGCTFNNLTNDRVSITANGVNTVASRITGCNFINVDMIHDNAYVQDFNFTNCYIQSHTCFIENTNSAVQARFVNCTVESESEQLIKAKNFVGYLSGTYEGNVNKDFYLIECYRGIIECNSCWLESVKFISLTGGNAISERSVLNFNNCNISGYTDSTPTITITNGEYVNINIFGSFFSAYNFNSRFCNLTPSSFEHITGNFIQTSVDTYNYPFGGSSNVDNKIANINDINNLENKRFIYKKDVALSTGAKDFTIPTGTYIAIIGRGSYNALNKTHMYIISVSNSQNYCYAYKIVGESDSYLDGTTLTPTKLNNNDTTFNLNVTATSGYTLDLCMIKIN